MIDPRKNARNTRGKTEPAASSAVAKKIYLGARFGASVRRPVLLAGVLTALVGVLIVAGWPANRFVILGVLLALDLAFWGAAWIGFGLRLRRY
jgi:uncharacterized membrane protein HdeD (DUF308 family)